MKGRQRRRSSRRARRPLLAAAVLAVGLVLSSAFAGITIQENALAREITDLQQQITAEQARGASLQAAVAEKRTQDYVIERAKRFGWVWPWEALIAVERESSERAVASDDGGPTRVERWIALFLH